MNTTPLRAALVVFALALLTLPSIASAQDEPPDPRKLSLEEIVDIVLDEGWEGSPEDLQAAYDALSPEERAEIEGFFESWSIEGGIGLLGGAKLELGDDAKTGGLFRANASIGAVWPVGDYAMPIYYALPDIPGPWAIGFQVFAAGDNFDTFVGGATMRWAYEYIGTTPYVEVGPAVRVGDDTAAGAHIDIGYGNILFQGFLQAEYFFASDGPILIMAGVRIPWLLFTLASE